MQETRAFQPFYKLTQSGQTGGLMPSVTVAATALGANASGSLGTSGGIDQVQIANTTDKWIYINFGILAALSAATVAASYPVAPGAVVVVTVDPEVNAASVIAVSAPSGSTNVVLTRGGGV